MDTAPQVSIVIPAYNEEEYVPRLLESIAATGERFGAVEVIVADNRSTDGTPEVAARFG